MSHNWCNFICALTEDSKNKLKNKKTISNAKVAANVAKRPEDLALEADYQKRSIVKADDDTVRFVAFD